MNFIYVISTGYYTCEGETVIEAYDSEKLARDRLEVLNKDKDYEVFYTIQELGLNVTESEYLNFKFGD
jgi:hypothetical protein